ncbi:MAG: hypothetical protein C0415_04965 [Thermodesulfovibrio sp.]|nr:hypothetical protein [Thermodesulfovibrio sp.]
MRKKVLFLFSSICLLAVLVFYLNQEKDIKPKLRLEGGSYMDNASITQRKDGMVKLIVNAQRAFFINEKDVKLTNMEIVFPEKELTLKSDGGMYDMSSRNLDIMGNIKASTKDYDIIATKLFWDSSKNEIFSDTRVEIVGRKFFAEGDNLTATGDKAILNKNVKAIFYGK